MTTTELNINEYLGVEVSILDSLNDDNIGSKTSKLMNFFLENSGPNWLSLLCEASEVFDMPFEEVEDFYNNVYGPKMAEEIC